MNALLIHNDNLPTKFVEGFESSMKFNIGLAKMLEYGFSFDRVAHEVLEEFLTDNQFDVIFIPYSLSNQNYLELSGIRLALHIRLTPEFNHTKVPIVFIGHETKEQIAKLTEFPAFLFTTGIFSTQKFEYNSFLEIFNWIINSWKPKGTDSILTEDEYKKFLTKINIEPPSNYLSHHSIDNELTLLRWSEFLKCDEEIPEVSLNIKTGLYFKLKRGQFPLEPPTKGYPYLIEGNARVLLIDDEAQKGWEHFYRTFFKTSPSIKFEFLNVDFKLNSKSTIIQEAIIFIKEYKPDVILLDLRLCDSDFDNNVDINELSGIKILDEVKKINKGIQVIITTASNKVLSFESVMKIGANGYILKNGESDVHNIISILQFSISKCIKRARFLKNIYASINTTLQNWDNYKLPERKNINDTFHDNLWHLILKSQVMDFFKNAFNTIENENIEERFTMSILLLFRIVEMMNEYFIIESGDKRDKTTQYHFDLDNTQVPRIINKNNNYLLDQDISKGTFLSTKEKCYAIYYKLNGDLNKSLFEKINNLTNYRNNIAIHPKKRFKEESLEYLYENNFAKFNITLEEYFTAVLDYIDSFK